MQHSSEQRSPQIDLGWLARRESEQVEWKENVANVDSVVKTIMAFANDWSNLGGGYVVCGAQESKDEHGFPKMLRPGLSAARFKEVEGRVISACQNQVDPPIVPRVEELPADVDDRRILIFLVPATPHAHSFRTPKDSGKHYIRVDRSTREARNSLLRELLVRKQALEPWDVVSHPEATLEEAMVNAVVHRDYASNQPTRVTVFADRVEIFSPGELPRTVDPEKLRIGEQMPVWRNQALAWFFNRLQLAQAEGQGIATILRVMESAGCPPPSFEVTAGGVRCVLPAHRRVVERQRRSGSA
jgi:predicted HTH transcriptional regulator